MNENRIWDIATAREQLKHEENVRRLPSQRRADKLGNVAMILAVVAIGVLAAIAIWLW